MIPFITKNPSAHEEDLLALMLATFTDGSGTQREADGSSRAGWREIERVFSEFWTGSKHSEDKDVFDVIVQDWKSPSLHYGASVKSKQITGSKTVFNGSKEARAYLEIANSPAKMWEGIISRTGVSAADFGRHESAQRVGDALLDTIAQWKADRARQFESSHPNTTMDLSRSYYVTLSWAPPEHGSRKAHIASFPMSFPKVTWRYTSERCLSADDPNNPGERLLDWYALSGGQLKYYPRYTEAHFQSRILTIKRLEEISILKKVAVGFTDEFKGLIPNLSREQIALIQGLIK
jgi:hypothetical protein